MASSSDIGANASNYVGNAGLGGGTFGSFQLDTKPIEDLAKYTMLYNKAEYDQRQKNADEKIKLIAENTAFDPNGAIEKDKEQARKIYNDLILKSSDYARKSPGTSEEKVKQYWDYQKDIADAQKSINSIKGRAIAYNTRMEAIKSNTSLTDAQKKQKIAQLNKDAESDIWTPIAVEEKFDETIPQVTIAIPRKIVVSSVLGDNNVTHDITVVTSTDLLRQSQSEATGIELTFTGENKEFFSGSNDPYKVFRDSAQVYNVVKADAKYHTKDANGNVVKDANGNPVIDYSLIKRDNPKLANVDGLIDDYNKWASDMKTQATDGVFTDRLGKTYQSITGVSPDDFFILDKNQPLTGDQMVMLEKWRKSAGKLLVTDEKLTPTGDATQRRGQDISAATTRRGQDLSYKIADRNLDLEEEKYKQEKEKWQVTMKGGDTVKNGAMEFANRLYGDMSKLADKNGVISPDKMRQLNQEQLKYAGSESVTQSAGGVAKSTYTPLSIPKGAAIQLINGEIRVLLDAEKLPDGRYQGTFDPTKSTNVFNIGTNRLNEQLRTAGAKELNSYMPIDLGVGGVSSNTSGGSSTTTVTSKETDADYYKRTGTFRQK